MINALTFDGSILLEIAILLGLVTVVLTFINSRKLKGEIFEKPFIYFALGLLFGTFSLIAVTFFQGSWGANTVSIVHDLSFIVGMGLLLLASMQIAKFLKGVESFGKNIEK
ncbi:hypothetical protein HN865_01195 [Candidatus Woesearchaeota archaeon]|jgi:hypothetical protein|nr:hypothetical protein [Candidatus Woesearchaeota archaeon]MBT7237452.1 hypothetical protein [Candidatus Woesearchaeota archaeon]